MKNKQLITDILDYYRNNKATLKESLQAMQNAIAEEIEILAKDQKVILTKDIYEVEEEK